MLTIQSMWQSFEKAVIPASAGPVQRLEMQKAFYAGASGVLALTQQIADIENEDSCVMALEGLHQEVRAYMDHISRDA